MFLGYNVIVILNFIIVWIYKHNVNYFTQKHSQDFYKKGTTIIQFLMCLYWSIKYHL